MRAWNLFVRVRSTGDGRKSVSKLSRRAVASLRHTRQRPFDHKDGVAEVPKWRILPDRVGSDASNAWQDDIGGGPLGWTGLLLSAQTIPAYLNDDWSRDWGSLERFTPYVPEARQADVGVTVRTRWGWAKDAPIKVK